ncbi:PPE family protein [Streptoalloteichus tenebrarius]|uniref:PPE family protein n=1 Tax=Streptoalloteichus tenebrarius (strain ATCC 17920 / DSM 40477 / JCM 4838 / CBS 697.72 / NBRC 16177 / NCIMB 11028 / NRRL B-12390 / A12253. 1 / ISP 5477) TaxID=1933 RepID=A0ABT1HY60_STRSD|nr:PPE domain-containing protein [Streptoalloteichus tenebrarius]MCP2260453.1 PPE family protein [Streptoalloteichus tenebrarius]BFF02751.1 hypothetical protein GCM10020241_44260 [Streptoalloteichus tenebrarius]
MGDHRWRGYTHEELYAQIHAGPGAAASASSVSRWAELTRALGEIDSDLSAALERCGGSWEGAAAEAARAGLTPLGQWACDARGGAEVMRLSAELQADYVSKARADMPQPVPVTAEEPSAAVTGLVHLFGGQTDYERQEAAADAAEQRAFEVMATYESSTRSNTSTLGEFSPPPEVVVATPAVTVAVGAGVAGLLARAPRAGGAVSAGGGARSVAPTQRPGSTPQKTAPPPRQPSPTTGAPSISVSANVSTASPGTPPNASPGVSSAPAGARGGPAPVPPQPGHHPPTVPGPRPAPPPPGPPAPRPVPTAPGAPPRGGATGRSTVDGFAGPRGRTTDDPPGGGRSAREEATSDGPRDHRGPTPGPFVEGGPARPNHTPAPAPAVGAASLPVPGVIGPDPVLAHRATSSAAPPSASPALGPARSDGEGDGERPNYLLPADDLLGDPSRPSHFGTGQHVVPPVIGESGTP